MYRVKASVTLTKEIAMFTRSESARQIARSIAYHRFRNHWDLRAILNDCESVAWQLEATAPPHVTPTSIAFIAVKRIRIGRQFKQSIRSITTSRRDKRSKRPDFQQVQIDLHDIAAVDAPPSESVPAWIDFKVWLSRYDDRKRGIAECLAVGGTTQEVARQFGVSDGRISQMRREFMRDWERFQAVG
jgi:hypothetical protein